MIRLLSRGGRRITLPVCASHSWKLVTKAPRETQSCSSCQQGAFFRHALGGEILWVCEEHLPCGARAYFPGDVPGAPEVETLCPTCQSVGSRGSSLPLSLPDGRTTTRLACESCGSCWSGLVSLGDDGTNLTADLSHMIENDLSISAIEVGLLAYDHLCRTLEMEEVAHFQGIPVFMQPALADTLALVFYEMSISDVRLDDAESSVQVGGTWISLTQPNIRATVLRAQSPRERASIQWHNGIEQLISHGDLSAKYRKLDIRSYWAILDMED